MSSGYYAAATALIARTQALDLIANNMANASTAGYKTVAPTFRSILAADSEASQDSAQRLGPVNSAINDFGTLEGTRVNFTQGGLEQTGNALDIAISGQAFFAVQSGSNELYTRSGSFHLSPTGGLVTADGNAVVGDQGPITLPPGVTTISSDGTISVNGVRAAQLKLVEFPEATPFTPVGRAYYQPPETATPLPGTTSSVRQGMLEASNVNPVEAVVQLIEAQRAVESLTHAMSMFNSQFDHTAAGELSRI